MRNSLTLFLFAIVFALPARAQTGTISEGSKIRFTTSTNQKLTGVVRARTADSLTIYTEPSGVPATVALTSISDLRISRGKSAMEGAKRGALWGTAVGAGLIGAVYLFGDPCPENSQTCKDDIGSASEAIGYGALGGVFWGTLIGAIVGREKWETASVRPIAGVSEAGTRLGFAISR